MKYIGYATLALILFTTVAWWAQGNDFFLYRFFAPKYEQVRRQTFEQSRAFNEGMIQQLDRERIEYLEAKDDSTKEAIADTVRHQYAAYDDSDLNPSLRDFLNQIRNQ